MTLKQIERRIRTHYQKHRRLPARIILKDKEFDRLAKQALKAAEEGRCIDHRDTKTAAINYVKVLGVEVCREGLPTDNPWFIGGR